jgi:hypothetical protein
LASQTIYQVTENDLLSIAIVKGNIYACRDTRKVYEDMSAVSRLPLDVTMLDTDNDRLYYIAPTEMTYYYVWETNTIWLYNKGWNLIVGTDTTNNVAYYNDNGLNSVSSQFVDTNGLLKDGSVIVRDNNRIIKGKLYIDSSSGNLIVSSFMGGEIDILPNGVTNELGSLTLSRSGLGTFNGKFETLQDMYVKLDDNEYKVYHQGNLQPDTIGIDSNFILSELQELPMPLDLSVNELNGLTSDKFSLAGHKHTTSDVTDIQTYTDERISLAMSGSTAGITIDYNSSTHAYDFSADTFVVSLVGGVTGSGTVTNLTNTMINTQVDPTKHVHDIRLMDHYQDLLDYEASQLSTGLAAKLDASEVVSVPTADKILRLDDNSNLPTNITGNSATATKLQNSVTITLIDGVSGSLVTDFSENSFIDVIVDPTKHIHADYLKDSDLGVTVAPLDQSGMVPYVNMPDTIKYSMRYQGTFDPNSGYPTTDSTGTMALSSGMYYIASAAGAIGTVSYNPGDLALYTGNDAWTQVYASVSSVNGYIGVISLAKSDIGLGNADNTPDVSKNVLSATKLTTPRTVSLSGDATGSVSFDGSGDVSIPTTLANSGVTAGTYTKLTVDSKGRATSGATLSASDIPTLTVSKISDAGTAASKNTGTASGNIPIIGSNGKIDTSILPALAITDTYVVSTQADMLALSAQTGDVAIRNDLQKSYILQGSDPTVLANWQELLTPPDVVQSVAGKTGVVILTPSDSGSEPAITAGTSSQYYRGDKTWQILNKAAVGLDQVDNTSDINKPISTSVQSALDPKADTDSNNRVIQLPRYVSNAVSGSGQITVNDTKSYGLFESIVATGESWQSTSSQNKNLFCPKTGTVTVNGITITVGSDGTITMDGTATGDSSIDVAPLLNQSESNPFITELTSGLPYTLHITDVSGTKTYIQIGINDNLGTSYPDNRLMQVENGQTNTLTAGTAYDSGFSTQLTVGHYFVYYQSGNVFSSYKFRVQFEQSSSATDWVQFVPNSPSPNYPAPITGTTKITVSDGGSNSQVITLSQPLYSLPDGTADSYDTVSGSGIQKVGKKVLNGSENGWGKAQETTNYVRFSIPISGVYAPDLSGNYCICDKFIGTKWNTAIQVNSEVAATFTGYVAIVILKSRLSGWFDSLTDAQKVALFTTWLSSNPVTVLYALATPVQITGTGQSVLAYDSSTVIFTNLGSISAVYSEYPAFPNNYYTKSQIDSMVGSIDSVLDAINGESA